MLFNQDDKLKKTIFKMDYVEDVPCKITYKVPVPPAPKEESVSARGRSKTKAADTVEQTFEEIVLENAIIIGPSNFTWGIRVKTEDGLTVDISREKIVSIEIEPIVGGIGKTVYFSKNAPTTNFGKNGDVFVTEAGEVLEKDSAWKQIMTIGGDFPQKVKS